MRNRIAILTLCRQALGFCVGWGFRGERVGVLNVFGKLGFATFREGDVPLDGDEAGGEGGGDAQGCGEFKDGGPV